MSADAVELAATLAEIADCIVEDAILEGEKAILFYFLDGDIDGVRRALDLLDALEEARDGEGS